MRNVPFQEVLIKDFIDILSNVQGVSNVSMGRPNAISEESNWNSIYVLPVSEVFEPYKNGTGEDAYNQVIFIKLVINSQHDDELEVFSLRSDISNAILDDTILWENVVDRDLVSVVYDEFEYAPKRQFEMVFQVIGRSTCQS